MSAQLAQTLKSAIAELYWLPTSDATQEIWERQQKTLGELRKALAAFEAAPQQEPVAWMWQHDETGRTGFVEAGFDRRHWEEHNPRLKIIRPVYAAPQQAQDKLDAERWREVLMRVSATRTAWGGGGHMFMVNIKPPSNVMQGSVAQHFRAAIDAARKAKP